jgi:signal peptidase I
MASMMNTVIPGDELLVTKSFGAIERGSIVVYQYPDDSTYYLARVVGLPGENIRVMAKNIYINKRELFEQRVTVLDPGQDSSEPLQVLSSEGQGRYQVFFFSTITDERRLMTTTQFATFDSFQIPDEFYFIMADNRDNSEDSRYRGPVPRDLIWGETSLIYNSVSVETGETRWDRVWKRIQ